MPPQHQNLLYDIDEPDDALEAAAAASFDVEMMMLDQSRTGTGTRHSSSSSSQSAQQQQSAQRKQRNQYEYKRSRSRNLKRYRQDGCGGDMLLPTTRAAAARERSSSGRSRSHASTSSSSTSTSTRKQYKSTRTRTTTRTQQTTHLYAFIGCLALVGTISTTLDLAAYTRRLERRARRLASCVVGMAVGEGDAAIQSTFGSWEDMFSRSFLSARAPGGGGGGGGGAQGDGAPSIALETDLAFAISLTSCPEDEDLPGVDNMYDPSHAFYDAAALLKYSLCAECAEVNVASRYNHTLYALVHPSARYCSVNGRPEYDRVAVLQSLGYRVEVKGEPVGIAAVSDPYLASNVESDVGIRDLMKLHAYTLTQHKVVVLIDFTTALLQPLDDAIDDLLASTARAAFAMDYATQLPADGLNHGVNLGLFMLKPSFASFTELVDTYETTPYSATMGWNSQGVGGFDGSMGTSGLLTHYYRSRPFIELDKCIYNNEAADPNGADGFCRDGNAQCDDCRLTVTNRIEAGRFDDAVCGKPWACSWDEGWDAATKEVCRYYHNNWFSNRLRFEQDFWIGGPEPTRNGTLHQDIFLGYCSQTGVDGYEPMIPDNYSPTASSSGTTTATARRRR